MLVTTDASLESFKNVLPRILIGKRTNPSLMVATIIQRM